MYILLFPARVIVLEAKSSAPRTVEKWVCKCSGRRPQCQTSPDSSQRPKPKQPAHCCWAGPHRPSCPVDALPEDWSKRERQQQRHQRLLDRPSYIFETDYPRVMRQCLQQLGNGSNFWHWGEESMCPPMIYRGNWCQLGLFAARESCS